MENIKVVVRVRPLNEGERLRQEESVFSVLSNDSSIGVNTQAINELLQTKKITLNTKLLYHFDAAFDQHDNNSQVFDRSVRTVSQSVIQGINSTIFMYGQTGSGKTYTTLGPIGDHNELPQQETYQKNHSQEFEGGDQGVLLLAMEDILNSIRQNSSSTYLIRCSYFEIYNESIFDLLRSRSEVGECLQVSESQSKKDFLIKGLKEVEISTIEDIIQVLYDGENNRHYAETILNHSSSRSHTIFKLHIHSYEHPAIAEAKLQHAELSESTNVNDPQLLQLAESLNGVFMSDSCLNFVDLAGSEKISNHQYLIEDNNSQSIGNGFGSEELSLSSLKVVRERIKESQSINKSLFFLTQVISLQSQNKHNLHIPYRNSTLTKILKSSLGGNSRTLVILCVTPTSTHFEQSLSTMRFGQNAKKIKNNVEVNQFKRFFDKPGDSIAYQQLQIELEKRISENYDMNGQIERLKQTLINVSTDKNDILEKLKVLMKRSIQDSNNLTEGNTTDTDDTSSLHGSPPFQGMFPAQLHKQAGLIFHTAETLKNNSIYASIDRNVCNLLFDYEGKIAFGIAKKLQQNLRHHSEKERIMEQNFNEIVKQYLGMYNELIDQKEELNNAKWKYTVMEKKYKALREAGENALKRLDLYESLSGVDTMSSEEINILENQLFSALDKIKLEKARRIFKDEINSLKIKLGLRVIQNDNSTVNEISNVYRKNSCNDVEDKQSIDGLNTDLRNALNEDDITDQEVIVQQMNMIQSQEIDNTKQRMNKINEQRDLLNQLFFQNIPATIQEAIDAKTNELDPMESITLDRQVHQKFKQNGHTRTSSAISSNASCIISNNNYYNNNHNSKGICVTPQSHNNWFNNATTNVNPEKLPLQVNLNTNNTANQSGRHSRNSNNSTTNPSCSAYSACSTTTPNNKQNNNNINPIKRSTMLKTTIDTSPMQSRRVHDYYYSFIKQRAHSRTPEISRRTGDYSNNTISRLSCTPKNSKSPDGQYQQQLSTTNTINHKQNNNNYNNNSKRQLRSLSYVNQNQGNYTQSQSKSVVVSAKKQHQQQSQQNHQHGTHSLIDIYSLDTPDVSVSHSAKKSPISSKSVSYCMTGIGKVKVGVVGSKGNIKSTQLGINENNSQLQKQQQQIDQNMQNYNTFNASNNNNCMSNSINNDKVEGKQQQGKQTQDNSNTMINTNRNYTCSVSMWSERDQNCMFVKNTNTLESSNKNTNSYGVANITGTAGITNSDGQKTNSSSSMNFNNESMLSGGNRDGLWSSQSEDSASFRNTQVNNGSGIAPLVKISSLPSRYTNIKHEEHSVINNNITGQQNVAQVVEPICKSGNSSLNNSATKAAATTTVRGKSSNNNSNSSSSSSSFIMELAQNLNNINEKIIQSKSSESSAVQSPEKKQINNNIINTTNRCIGLKELNEMNVIKEEDIDNEQQQQKNQQNTHSRSSSNYSSTNNNNNRNTSSSCSSINSNSNNTSQLSSLMNPLKAQMKQFKRKIVNVLPEIDHNDIGYDYPDDNDSVTKILMVQPQPQPLLMQPIKK